MTANLIKKTPAFTKAFDAFVAAAVQCHKGSVDANWGLIRVSETRFSLAYNGEGIGDTFTADKATAAIKRETKALKLRNGWYEGCGW